MFLLKLSCIKLHSTSLEQSSCIVIQFQILLDYNTLKKCIKITGKIRVINIDMHFHSNTGQQTDSITQSKSWFASGKEKEHVYSVMYCIVVLSRHMSWHYKVKCTSSLTRPFAQLILFLWSKERIFVLRGYILICFSVWPKSDILLTEIGMAFLAIRITASTLLSTHYMPKTTLSAL